MNINGFTVHICGEDVYVCSSKKQVLNLLSNLIPKSNDIGEDDK